MIQPINAAASQAITYAGGVASSSKPGFAASLQATLAQLQATNNGLTAANTHHHHPNGTAPFQSQASASGSSIATQMPPAL